MPFKSPTHPTTSRVIPTERLDALCIEYRENANIILLTIEQLSFAIGKLDIDQEDKLLLIEKLLRARPNLSLLIETESYLKYNKRKLIANRRREAASAKERFDPPEYISPKVHDYLPEEPTTIQTPQEIAKEWEEYQRWNAGASQPPPAAATSQPKYAKIKLPADYKPTTPPQAGAAPTGPTTITDSSGTTHTFRGQTLPEVLDKSALTIKRR